MSQNGWSGKGVLGHWFEKGGGGGEGIVMIVANVNGFTQYKSTKIKDLFICDD